MLKRLSTKTDNISYSYKMFNKLGLTQKTQLIEIELTANL